MTRMDNAAVVLPAVLRGLQAVQQAVDAELPASLVALVQVRASQINGCSVCLDAHLFEMRKNGETDERMGTVAAWRDAPYFTEAERAALALTECVTRMADRPDAVPDAVWAAAADHYSSTELAALLVAIASINVWNRLNVATRQIAGWRPA